jgi:LmbE family N-acetylglucosaminyl deacetylase
MSAAGWDAHVIVMGCAGKPSRHQDRPIHLAERECEMRAAAQIIGANAKILYPGMDAALETLSQTTIVTDLDAEIDRIKPGVAFIPLDDMNRDHQITARTALAALRPTAYGRDPITVVGYETATLFWPQTPSHYWLYANIADQLEKKLAALACYKTQIKSFPHPVSLQAAAIRATALGIEGGCEAAERFVLIRSVIQV